ncbi:hypothetical protein ACJ70E_08025 [Pseudomonas plecoglossicida]|uniref:hypothetical protein n=1 Tax=Pseudomonas plecoglossicida TaxID=70775 RepID=UPI00397744E9
MDEFWIHAVKVCGSGAIAGLLGYTVWPSIIASPYLEKLSPPLLFALLIMLMLVTFITCLALIKVASGRSAGNNTVNIKGSTIHGSVQAGNNTHDKK